MGLDQSIKEFVRTVKNDSKAAVEGGLLNHGLTLGTIIDVDNQEVKLDYFSHPVNYLILDYPLKRTGTNPPSREMQDLKLLEGDRVLIAVVNEKEFIILGVLK